MRVLCILCCIAALARSLPRFNRRPGYEAFRLHTFITVPARMHPLLSYRRPRQCLYPPSTSAVHTTSHFCLRGFRNVSHHIQSSSWCFPALESIYLSCIISLFFVSSNYCKTSLCYYFERMPMACCNISSSSPISSSYLLVHRMQPKFLLESDGT